MRIGSHNQNTIFVCLLNNLLCPLAHTNGTHTFQVVFPSPSSIESNHLIITYKTNPVREWEYFCLWAFGNSKGYFTILVKLMQNGFMGVSTSVNRKNVLLYKWMCFGGKDNGSTIVLDVCCSQHEFNSSRSKPHLLNNPSYPLLKSIDCTHLFQWITQTNITQFPEGYEKSKCFLSICPSRSLLLRISHQRNTYFSGCSRFHTDCP